jgi:hypothetical protein
MAGSREEDAAARQQIVWEPLPRQSVFIQCPCSDVGFGGARGGGKSWAILGDWIGHEEQFGKHAIGLVLRRERTQLIELIESAKQVFLPLGYAFKDSTRFSLALRAAGFGLRIWKATPMPTPTRATHTRAYISRRRRRSQVRGQSTSFKQHSEAARVCLVR